jgi:hypothetical protein
MATRFKAWNPFVPQTTPPIGYYDPALDINLAGAQRGLFDAGQDTETAAQRLGTDYQLGLGDINLGATRNLEDVAAQRANLGVSHDRALEDIGISRQQGTENYDTDVRTLGRAYQRKAQSQRQAQNSAGLLRGGAVLQAAGKRTANQAIDRAPIDTGFHRLIEGLDRSTGRVNEDFTRNNVALDQQQQRITEDQQRQAALLALTGAPPDAGNPLGGRSYQDLMTQFARAQREGAAFGIDTASTKAAQAAQAGWDPYAGRPTNEFGSGTTARRVIVRGGVTYVVDPTGRVISSRRR